MANFQLKINLSRLNGAFVTPLRGKTAEKLCLCIPIEDAQLFQGQSSVYLDLNLWERRDGVGKYGDTHYAKQRFSKAYLDSLSDDQRRALPFIGDMRPRPDYGNLGEAPAEPPRPAESEDQLPF